MTASLQSHVVVIPAYNESETLPLLLAELAVLCSRDTAIVVVDDSRAEVAELTRRRCLEAVAKQLPAITFLNSARKGGRGDAVRRGLEHAIQIHPHARWFLECDADGSHQAVDIVAILNSQSHNDLIIGSRYLPNSRIIGWTPARRIQSRILNWAIPKALSIPITDITNGLRRYSRAAINQLLQHHPVSTGFIFLTEQALIVDRGGFRISEVPIVFAERRAGVSSVTIQELRNSVDGLRKILSLRKNFKKP